MAHVRQPRPHSGLGRQGEVLTQFHVVPFFSRKRFLVALSVFPRKRILEALFGKNAYSLSHTRLLERAKERDD